MRTLIVDDERLARNELKRLLRHHGELKLVGEAANAEEARGLIERLRPELLFLDIHMPGQSGFELLGELDHAPPVIFTTAHDDYAIRAFEVNALDYLLKPVEAERLAHAVEKVLLRKHPDHEEEMSQHGELTEAICAGQPDRAREAAKAVCKQRYLEFGCEGQAGKIKPIGLSEIASMYATGKLAQIVA